MAICPSCRTSNDERAEVCGGCQRALSLRAGLVLADRYEILAHLGRGGMGSVYKAHDRTLEETVAVKTLRGDVAESPDMSRRFRAEIRLSRKIGHRNVCRIYEYGEDQALRFIAMEFIDGVDLRHVISERGPFGAEEGLDVVLQVAAGLEAIHEAGVIHRDLKTANLMRDPRGIVKLMDFGIAKQWGADATQHTATGTVLGTPEYMSPEQARGMRIDPRSDLYAFGVVIYELFTGAVPFRGTTPFATVLMHIQQPPPLDGPQAARIPRPLIPVLEKALAKSPDGRYNDSVAMAEAIRAAQAEIKGSTSPRGNTPPPSRAPVVIHPRSTPATPVPAAAEPTYVTPPPSIAGNGLPEAVAAYLRDPAPSRPHTPTPAYRTPTPAPAYHTPTPAPSSYVEPTYHTPIPQPSPPAGSARKAVRRSWLMASGVVAVLGAVGVGMLIALVMWLRAGHSDAPAVDPSPAALVAANAATPKPTVAPTAKPSAMAMPAATSAVVLSPKPIVAPTMKPTAAPTPTPSPTVAATPVAVASVAPALALSLRVTSTPPAQVSLDGKPLGSTPVTAAVVIGTHTLRFTHPAYRPYSRKVTVAAGQNPSVDINLAEEAFPAPRR